MKSIILIVSFLFTVTTLSAQTVAATDIASAAEVQLTATNGGVPGSLAVAHTKTAAAQIGEHLSQTLYYPAEMEELAMEGILTASIYFSPKGKVSRVSIAQTELPEAFHRELQKSLSTFKKLKLNGAKYQGDTVLKVPVHFSL